MHSPSALFTQILVTLRSLLDHTQLNGFPGLQVAQVDATGVDSLVRLLHCLKHDRAVVSGDVAHQVYPVSEAALVLEEPTTLLEVIAVEVIAPDNLLLRGRSKA